MKVLFAFLPLMLCPIALAQTAPTASAKSATSAQSRFEIADVHASTTTRGFGQSFGGVVHDGFYVNRDTTMLQMIEAAYGVAEDTVAGGPGWIGADLFDVVAKVPAGTTKADANAMLRSLLSERFGLVARNEERPVPRYVLTVGTGAKMKPTAGGDGGCKPVNPPTGPLPADPAQQPNIKIRCTSMTAVQIAAMLHDYAGGYLDHEVVDATKLDGAWDFDLEWTGRGLLAAKGADGISIFDAVSKQMGLKLAVQNMPQPALAIISVNRKPTANAAGVATTLALPSARFEVATIKPADPNAKPFVGILYQGGSTVHAGGTLRDMVALALQVSPNVATDTVIGLPKSASTQSWDIVGKLPAAGEGAVQRVNGDLRPPPLSTALEMLRGVLLDQFELKTHTENREVSVYLLQAIGKSKMTRAEDTERAGCRPNPGAPKPVTGITVMAECKNTSMVELAQNLQQQASAYIDHPIVDDTGLEGGWDFLIGWTPKAQLEAPRAPDANGNASFANGISVFDAVERELGLKLVKGKRSIPVIVVDHLDEKPLE